jgi:hypothetical protein
MTLRVPATAVLGVTVLTITSSALGQSTAPTAATSRAAPTTATSAPAPYRLVVPPGFVKVTANGRTALAEAADATWVREALTQASPATRPSTMPADIAARLTSVKSELAKQIASDLGTVNPADIEKFLETEVLPRVQKLHDLRPPIVYMPVTRDKLLQVVAAGWDNPRFYYNRAANDVQWLTNLQLDPDNPMSDQTLPIVYASDTPPEQRKQALIQQIQGTEPSLLNALAGEAVGTAQNQFLQYIDDKVFRPVGIKHGQEWFAVGIESVLATRYSARIAGVDPANALRAMGSDDARNPIRSATIDLLNPTPAEQLRPQAGPAYVDALRRKSIAVVNGWLSKIPPDALPKSLAAFRDKKPADGSALVKIIQEQTGVDLTQQLLPR